MSRRPSYGFRANRRGIAHVVAGGGDGPVTALTYVDAGKVLAYYRADLGVTDDPGVSQWNDQGAGAYHLTGTGTQRPTYSATGGPNSTAMVSFNGTTNSLKNATLQLPTPGVGTVRYWIICRHTVDAAFDTMICAPRSTAWECGIARGAVGPQYEQYNTGASNRTATVTVNTWFRFGALFTGSTSDKTVVNGTAVTGTSCGTTVPTQGIVVGSRDSGASTFGAFDFAEILVLNADISGAEDTALAAYQLARYGF